LLMVSFIEVPNKRFCLAMGLPEQNLSNIK
jgi:hypothetical protein